MGMNSSALIAIAIVVALAALAWNWVFWDVAQEKREKRKPITFTYEDLATFMEQPETQFEQGDIVILRDTGKRFKRDGEAWQGVRQ